MKMVREDTLQAVDTIPETASLVERIKKALAPYMNEVKFAFLFGSYASGNADIWSDVDIGLYFSERVSDEKKNQIRFALMDAVAPLEAQIGYLDDEEAAPEIFIAATEGLPLLINDEDVYHRALMKNIHLREEMKLIGLIE